MNLKDLKSKIVTCEKEKKRRMKEKLSQIESELLKLFA